MIDGFPDPEGVPADVPVFAVPADVPVFAVPADVLDGALVFVPADAFGVPDDALPGLLFGALLLVFAPELELALLVLLVLGLELVPVDPVFAGAEGVFFTALLGVRFVTVLVTVLAFLASPTTLTTFLATLTALPPGTSPAADMAAFR
ncbi:MAG: hypothetical protein FWF88_11685 [Peptococcaceae bacterium]|nr:hypothetical protein [Peptococcaceae bacterium]